MANEKPPATIANTTAEALAIARQPGDDLEPILGPQTSPVWICVRILTREEALQYVVSNAAEMDRRARDKRFSLEVKASLEKGWTYFFENQNGDICIGMTRRGWLRSEEKP